MCHVLFTSCIKHLLIFFFHSFFTIRVTFFSIMVIGIKLDIFKYGAVVIKFHFKKNYTCIDVKEHKLIHTSLKMICMS